MATPGRPQLRLSQTNSIRALRDRLRGRLDAILERDRAALRAGAWVRDVSLGRSADVSEQRTESVASRQLRALSTPLTRRERVDLSRSIAVQGAWLARLAAVALRELRLIDEALDLAEARGRLESALRGRSLNPEIEDARRLRIQLADAVEKQRTHKWKLRAGRKAQRRATKLPPEGRAIARAEIAKIIGERRRTGLPAKLTTRERNGAADRVAARLGITTRWLSEALPDIWSEIKRAIKTGTPSTRKTGTDHPDS
jgi:hypothetical protein